MSDPNEGFKDTAKRIVEEKDRMLAAKVNAGFAHGLDADDIRKIKDGSEEVINAQAELLAELKRREPDEPDEPELTGEQLAFEKKRQRAEAFVRSIHPERRSEP